MSSMQIDETRCRSCGAEIVWRKHRRTGKRAPIEAQSHPAGNVELLSDGVSYVTYGQADAELRRTHGMQLYRNHFMTCPQGRSWKRGTRNA